MTVAVRGVARVGRRTKDLTSRVAAGDIVVIDHEDLDRVAAEALVERAPTAVLNASRSISGRYPNLGPKILVDAGILLLDHLGPDVMTAIPDGATVDINGQTVLVDDTPIASGTVMDLQDVEQAMEDARAGLNHQLELFAENTMSYMLKERDLLLDGVGVPDIRTPLKGRQVLIVVRGYHYKEDLHALRSYIRENRPVVIGVDGGADAVVEAGYRVDMIIGDMDSVSDRTLASGAELIVHAYRDGRAPGLERLESLGVAEQAVIFPASGTSEDIAMLLADEKGATVIVAVGTHGTLVEFLDKGRAGMSSTFLTRLRVGSKLVDAKGVSRLYRQRISTAQLTMLALAGLLALLVALWSTPGGQALFQILGARVDDIVNFFTSLFAAHINSSLEV
ncbi:putative cytokinetic ring protein SteA [Devriesea agamarum]|uniref:putative cytokinetic ring protein SteA n=1 Tax=Devriesea agamarum TaxID=472569 RepID=UPI00071C7BB8|nr:putative cytokinetic ring protein SteA [Devriesea agamarum]